MPHRTVMLLCAYLGPLSLVPLLVARRDPDAQWHARQGLLMSVVELVLLGGLSVVAGATVLTNLGVGVALLVALWLLWVAVVAVHLAAIVVALNHGRLRVPGVSTLAEFDWEHAVGSVMRGIRTRVRPR